MTDTPTTSGQEMAAIGPGRLVLVVGPSGAGKDTLLRLAQAACAGDPDIVFTRRIVTREATAFEENQQVSPKGFQHALARGEFAIHWQAHGHSYALPGSIDDDVRAARTVVANVSRAVVSAVRQRYADVTVVTITAPSEILAERLAARARLSDGKIEDRLRRAVEGAVVVPDVTISNVKTAEIHARKLVEIIRGD